MDLFTGRIRWKTVRVSIEGNIGKHFTQILDWKKWFQSKFDYLEIEDYHLFYFSKLYYSKASGKSTFIKTLEDAAANENWEITPEPVSTWTQIYEEGETSSGGNLLKLFYDDPKTWCYTFQTYALLSRMKLHRAPFATQTKARLSERSLYSDWWVWFIGVNLMMNLTTSFLKNDDISQTKCQIYAQLSL